MAPKNTYSLPRKSAKANFQNTSNSPPTHKLRQMKLNEVINEVTFLKVSLFSSVSYRLMFISDPQTLRLLILVNVKINIFEEDTWRVISRQLQITSNKET